MAEPIKPAETLDRKPDEIPTIPLKTNEELLIEREKNLENVRKRIDEMMDLLRELSRFINEGPESVGDGTLVNLERALSLSMQELKDAEMGR